MMTQRICLLLLIVSAAKAASADFVETCESVLFLQRAFDGRCDLESGQALYQRLKESLAALQQRPPPTGTVQQFVKQDLFAGATKFFRDTYENQSFVSGVDNLSKELNLVADRMIKPSDITLKDIFDTIERSQFNKTAKKMFDFLSNTTNNGDSSGYTCFPNNNVCPRIEEFLGARSEQYTMNLTAYLKETIESVYTKLSDELTENDKKQVLDFVDKLELKGTNAVNAAEFLEILKSRFVNQTIEFFNDEKPPKRRTKSPTTKKPIKSTTPKIKVINVVAVDQTVLLAVPSSFLLLGFVGAALIALFVYKCQPMRSHLTPNLSSQAKIKPEPMQMIIRKYGHDNVNKL